MKSIIVSIILAFTTPVLAQDFYKSYHTKKSKASHKIGKNKETRIENKSIDKNKEFSYFVRKLKKKRNRIREIQRKVVLIKLKKH